MATSVGQDLRGADLRDQDLRGADLRGADLRGADLRGVRTGLPLFEASLVVVVMLAASVGLGVVAGFIGEWLVASLRSPDPLLATLAAILGAAILEALIALAWRGARYTLRRVLAPVLVLAVLSGVISVAMGIGSGDHVVVFVSMFALVAVVLLAGTLARVTAGTLGVIPFFVVAFSGALAGKFVGGGMVAVLIAVSAMIAGRRALGGGTEFAGLERATLRLVLTRATRLSGADLRGARLEATKLVGCDFRGARLEGATLDRAHATHCLFDEPLEPPEPPGSHRL